MANTSAVAKSLLPYVWPALLASLGSVVVGLTDSALISYYATDALAGVALGATLYELPVNVMLGIVMAYRILAPRINSKTQRETFEIKIFLRLLVPAAAGFSFGDRVASVAACEQRF